MKWSRDQSIVLSKICVLVFAAAELICAAGLPLIADGIIRRRGWELFPDGVYFFCTVYLLMIPASIALAYLYRLLGNISREEVFVDGNVSCLRRISWACYLAAGICAVSGFFYLPFWMLAAAAGFMGLILRIVKNIFAEAVNLKQENDFTI